MSKQKSENTVTDSRSIAVVLRTDEPIHQSQKFQTVQNVTTMKSLLNRLREINWGEFKNCEDPNEAYFLKNLFQSTIIFFPKVKYG